MSKKIALIDGYGFVFRAYHSLPPLTRADGTPVGAVYGFTNMLIKLIAGLDVSHVAVVFDSGSKTFRNEIYPAYKANRPPCPEDLKPQFAIVREAAESLNLPILEKIGFEADDIIATIAKKSSREGYDVVIISSDKDLMQLVNERIFMYDAMKNKFIGINEVKEKFFVEPQKVLEVLSLIGDASDNVPGVRGIGPKTAAELINQFGSVEGIFANLEQIKQEKRRQLLQNGIENAKLSKILIALAENVEIGIEIEDLKVRSIDPNKLLAFLANQGFRSLETRVRKEFGVFDIPTNPKSSPDKNGSNKSSESSNNNCTKQKNLSFGEIKKTKISSLEIIDRINLEAVRNGSVTIDYHSNAGEIGFITISTAKHNEPLSEIFYFTPQNHKHSTSSDLFSFTESQVTNANQAEFGIEILQKILFDHSIKKIFFEAKPFLKLAAENQRFLSSSEPIETRVQTFGNVDLRHGLKIQKINSYEDVSLINHLLNSAIRQNLQELINSNLEDDIAELGFDEIFATIDNKTSKESDRKNVEFLADEKKKIEFFSFRNFSIHRLYHILSSKIFELKLSEAYFSYELPVLEVIAAMEVEGIGIDVAKLHSLSEEFAKNINVLQGEIYKIAGCEFNIASTQQLSGILFEKLGLVTTKKSKKTGSLSTNHDVLGKLEEEGHVIASKILGFRKFSKLKNTYTDSLPKEINPKTGRIHSNFSTISTVTGRLSSNHPNLQNIPIRTAEGRKIRESFIARKGHVLISADYSQIELRVIAHVANIENLITAFQDKKDIHRITASEVFKIPENEVSDDLRSKAKAINFGIIYGISAFGLAKQLNITRQEAGDYINSYLHAYPGIDLYMRNTIESARRNGYVQTLSGRKCFIHGINDKNHIVRSEAERLSINAPIQGSAADIVKKAMKRVYDEFLKREMSARILLQIHDELIVETEESNAQIVMDLLKQKMENAVILNVPIIADVKAEKSWK